MTVYANKGAGSSSTIAGVTILDDQNSYFNKQALINEQGAFATMDDESTDGLIPQNSPIPPVETEVKEEDNKKPTEKPQSVTDCAMIVEPIDYEFQLTPNFKLKQLSLTAVFPHSIKAQHGLSPADIACNLKALAEQVLEPLWAMYPGFRINSGFRTSTGGRSQHERGQAVDIQWPGLSYDEYWNRAQQVKDVLNFDQFIFEHGNSVWFHLSFNNAGNRPKSHPYAVCTMYGGSYTPGLKKYR